MIFVGVTLLGNAGGVGFYVPKVPGQPQTPSSGAHES
jgi:hypothetical protein